MSEDIEGVISRLFGKSDGELDVLERRLLRIGRCFDRREELSIVTGEVELRAVGVFWKLFQCRCFVLLERYDLVLSGPAQIEVEFFCLIVKFCRTFVCTVLVIRSDLSI